MVIWAKWCAIPDRVRNSKEQTLVTIMVIGVLQPRVGFRRSNLTYWVNQRQSRRRWIACFDYVYVSWIGQGWWGSSNPVSRKS